MPFDPSLLCPWQCHLIGGPWISENPDCPFHGRDRVDLETLEEEEGRRMCAAETARSKAERYARRVQEYESEGEDF